MVAYQVHRANDKTRSVGKFSQKLLASYIAILGSGLNILTVPIVSIQNVLVQPAAAIVCLRLIIPNIVILQKTRKEPLVSVSAYSAVALV